MWRLIITTAVLWLLVVWFCCFLRASCPGPIYSNGSTSVEPCGGWAAVVFADDFLYFFIVERNVGEPFWTQGMVRIVGVFVSHVNAQLGLITSVKDHGI